MIINNNRDLINAVENLNKKIVLLEIENKRLRAQSNLASRVPVYATVAERDGAIPNPVNGNICYNTAANSLQAYEAGAWGNI